MPADDLDDLIATCIDEDMEEWPVRATYLGIDGHDDRLGDFSREGVERRERWEDKWLATFSAVDDDGLSHDQRIDRDLALSALRGRAALRDWEAWRREPALYLNSCLSGVFTLFLQRSHPEPDLVGFASARLREVPRVLAEGKANLDAELANPVIVERGQGQCRAGIGYARDLVPAEVEDEGLRNELAGAGEIAARAFEDFARFLDDLASRAAGSYALGEQRYSALLQEKELLGYGAAEMRERGRAAYDESTPRCETWRHGCAAPMTGAPSSTSSTPTTRPHPRRCATSTKSGPSGPGSSSSTTSW